MPGTPVYGELRIRLPRFVVIALRLIVEEANAEDIEGERWTVSLLMEMFLMKAFGKEDVNHWYRLADKSPDFRHAAEAWIRRESPKLIDDAGRNRKRKRST